MKDKKKRGFIPFILNLRLSISYKSYRFLNLKQRLLNEVFKAPTPNLFIEIEKLASKKSIQSL